jgi:hypothetical protein
MARIIAFEVSPCANRGANVGTSIGGSVGLFTGNGGERRDVGAIDFRVSLTPVIVHDVKEIVFQPAIVAGVDAG